MPEGQFRELTEGLSDRSLTYPALLSVRAAEVETLRRALEILDAHEKNAGRSVIRPLIQAQVQWQQGNFGPAMQSLQQAMNDDFDASVRMVGGVMFLPVPAEEAWENYVAPIRDLIEAFRAETTPALEAVAAIEDRYLFV